MILMEEISIFGITSLLIVASIAAFSFRSLLSISIPLHIIFCNGNDDNDKKSNPKTILQYFLDVLVESQEGSIIHMTDQNVRDTILQVASNRSRSRSSITKNDSHTNNETIKNASPMKHQVGGLSSTKNPILTLKPNFLLKPFQTDDRGLREVAFYEIMESIHELKLGIDADADADTHTDFNSNSNSVSKSNILATLHELLQGVLYRNGSVYKYKSKHKYETFYPELHLLQDLSRFMVDYYGITKDLPSYMILSDETIPFVQPCIIDLKIGTKTYEPDAKPSKKKSQMKKYPQQQLFGFRIVGMRKYQYQHTYDQNQCESGGEVDSPHITKMDKLGGRSLITNDNMLLAFKSFFNMNDSNHLTIQRKKRIVIAFLSKLQSLRHLIVDPKNSIALYASSLLLMYEGVEDEPSISDESVVLKMIDFAHVRKQSGVDEGYLHGIDNIIRIFNEIITFIDTGK